MSDQVAPDPAPVRARRRRRGNGDGSSETDDQAGPAFGAASSDSDDLPRCGALVLSALIANNGITGIELDPQTETLFLRYDPRRTTPTRVQEIAESLRPVLQRSMTHADQAAASSAGAVDSRPHLFPATTVQRVGRIRVEEAQKQPVHVEPQVEQEDRSHDFLLQVIQPGLVGLMDGSVSTLAPLFATAYATHNHTTALLVGLAAAVGAAISMGFAEALSDDGVLTGRGAPVARGVITGGMTFVGGVGHSLPFLIADFKVALLLAYVVVMIELTAISLIRTRYFQAPFVLSAIQVIVGGALVFASGVLIGSA